LNLSMVYPGNQSRDWSNKRGR